MPVDFTRDVLIRWDSPEPAHVALLKQAGVSAVIPSVSSPAFAEACSTAGIAIIAPAELPTLKLAELHAAPSRPTVALAEGLWPGIRRPPAVAGRGDETASASREPWVDSNGYWIGYLRALYPNRPPLLGYLPDKLEDRIPPFDSLELALIEAWAAGGNYILSLEKSYREALLRNDDKAKAAWDQLGRTVRWLRENVALFRQSNIPIVTAVVDQGAASAEIANLLYRRNASPALTAAAALPPPDPHSRLAIVAANLKQPDPQVAKKILAHAEAGAIVVAAAPLSQPWWKVPALKPVRSEPDRDFFSLATGQVVAYKRPIADPSEFALDVIDLITHKRRAVRLWNGPSVIALATSSPQKGERLVHLLNYGSPIDMDVQVRVQGHFTKATLLRPDASPAPLQAARRGGTTEVQVPALRRLGVVVFG